MKSSRRAAWVLYVAMCAGACILSLVLSCSGDKSSNVKKDEGCPARSTPDLVLKALECSYETKDIEAYSEVLDDRFMFVFTADVADSLSLPAEDPWWGKEAELSATGNMFSDPGVTNIDLDLVELVPWYACEMIRWDATIDGVCCLLEVDIRVTVERTGEEPWTLLVGGTVLHVAVAPDPNVEGLWNVLEIEENYQPALPSTISWGRLKLMWYQQP